VNSVNGLVSGGCLYGLRCAGLVVTTGGCGAVVYMKKGTRDGTYQFAGPLVYFGMWLRDADTFLAAVVEAALTISDERKDNDTIETT